MRILDIALAATALCAFPSLANAAVTGSLGTGTGQQLTLSSAGLDGGAVATLAGGTVYTADQPFADIPKGDEFGNTFLAAGPTSGAPAMLTFTQPISYLSFLWGSPDLYNKLTLTTNLGTYLFDAAALGFSTTNGNQAVSQYVQFNADVGESIQFAFFDNVPAIDAFEVANFSVAAVPEPATWAMMFLGFGMMGASIRYRGRETKVVHA